MHTYGRNWLLDFVDYEVILESEDRIRNVLNHFLKHPLLRIGNSS